MLIHVSFEGWERLERPRRACEIQTEVSIFGMITIAPHSNGQVHIFGMLAIALKLLQSVAALELFVLYNNGSFFLDVIIYKAEVTQFVTLRQHYVFISQRNSFLYCAYFQSQVLRTGEERTYSQYTTKWSQNWDGERLTVPKHDGGRNEEQFLPY